jgi:ribosomal protein S8E
MANHQGTTFECDFRTGCCSRGQSSAQKGQNSKFRWRKARIKKVITEAQLIHLVNFCGNIATIIYLVLTVDSVVVKTEWEDNMTKLTVEQLIYLLYASAYTEADTVTKSTVKSYLPSEWKEKAEKIYDSLGSQGLIEQTSKGRFFVTEQGTTALVTNLVTTDYKFDSVKGPKVLNVLLTCIKKASEVHPQIKPHKEMSFDEFQEKFQALYFEERRQQELRGVVAIHSDEICHKFREQNPISQDKLSQYFELLKSAGKVFAVDEKGNELIQWVE